jgi:hypothetical protein
MKQIEAHAGITRAKLANVRERIDAARRILRELDAEEAAIIAACPHVNEQGEPLTEKCWSEPGNGWCAVCRRGFALDAQKRPAGPWKTGGRVDAAD